jgi:cytochrome c biogenesis protein CcdA
MNFGPATYGLGLLVAAALNAHRWGAMALGIGLALSFTIVGIFLATLGASLGLDPDTFRTAGACILAVFGLILLVPKLQDLFTRATSTLSDSGNQLLARFTFGGLLGQFFVGVSLGLVWSPCVGPTLGAATTLASQGKDLGQIGLLMLIFGIGAAAPLVMLGSLSRTSMMKVRAAC